MHLTINTGPYFCQHCGCTKPEVSLFFIILSDNFTYLINHYQIETLPVTCFCEWKSIASKGLEYLESMHSNIESLKDSANASVSASALCTGYHHTALWRKVNCNQRCKRKKGHFWKHRIQAPHSTPVWSHPNPFTVKIQSNYCSKIIATPYFEATKVT